MILIHIARRALGTRQPTTNKNVAAYQAPNEYVPPRTWCECALSHNELRMRVWRLWSKPTLARNVTDRLRSYVQRAPSEPRSEPSCFFGRRIAAVSEEEGWAQAPLQRHA